MTIFFGLTIALLVSSPWFNLHETYISELGNPFGPGEMMGMYYVNPVAPYYNGTVFLAGLFLLVFALYFGFLFMKTRSIYGLLGGVFGGIVGCIGVILALNPLGSPLGWKLASDSNLIVPVLFFASWILIMVALAPIFLGHDKTASILFAFLTGLLIIYNYCLLLGYHCQLTCQFYTPFLLFLSEIALFTSFGIISVLFIIRDELLLQSIV